MVISARNPPPAPRSSSCKKDPPLGMAARPNGKPRHLGRLVQLTDIVLAWAERTSQPRAPTLPREGVQHQAAVGRLHLLALGREQEWLESHHPGHIFWLPSLGVSLCPVAVPGWTCLLPCLPFTCLDSSSGAGGSAQALEVILLLSHGAGAQAMDNCLLGRVHSSEPPHMVAVMGALRWVGGRRSGQACGNRLCKGLPVSSRALVTPYFL